MISCDADSCPLMWYHVDCVGLQARSQDFSWGGGGGREEEGECVCRVLKVTQISRGGGGSRGMLPKVWFA